MKRRKSKQAGDEGARKPAGGEARQEEPGPSPSQYIFSFEMLRQYPTVRSFIVKGQLKKSFGDTVSELFGGSKKGVYKF